MMKKILLVLPLLFCLVSCSGVYRYTKSSYFAMNTVVDVIRNEQIEEDYTFGTVNEIEKSMSRTRADSEISRINNGEDVVLSEQTVLVLERALEIAKATDYAFNPCMGTLTDLWDITSGNKYVPSEKEIGEALTFCTPSLVSVSDNRVVMPDGMKIDLGGIAKGYALEMACKEMKKGAKADNASPDFCVSLGGNVGVSGSSESVRKSGGTGWNVGIENPFGGETTVGSLLMTDGYVAVSGAYERFFEKDGVIYHHIFDPKTGKPSESTIASVAVVCDDGLLGDALSTALFVMDEEKALEFYRKGIYGFEMIVVMKDGRVLVTENIADAFSLNKKAVDADNKALRLEIIN